MQNFKQTSKTFYLGAIGQLILCRNIIKAREIVKSIFIIALSETDRNSETGHSTHCDLERIKLTNLMTASDVDLENRETDNDDSAVFEIENEDNETNIFNPFENSWTTWSKKILYEVKSLIASDVGDRIRIIFHR